MLENISHVIVAICFQTQLVDASSQSTADSKMAQADPQLLAVKKESEEEPNVQPEQEPGGDAEIQVKTEAEIQVNTERERAVAVKEKPVSDTESDTDDLNLNDMTDAEMRISLGVLLGEDVPWQQPLSPADVPPPPWRLPLSPADVPPPPWRLAGATADKPASSSAVPNADNPTSSLAGPCADGPWRQWKRDRLEKASLPLTSKAPAPTPPPMPADPMPPKGPRKNNRLLCADPTCRNLCQDAVHGVWCRWCASHCPGKPTIAADLCKVHWDSPFRCVESSVWCLNKAAQEPLCIESKCGAHCNNAACRRHFGDYWRPKSTNKCRGQRTNRPAPW